MFLTEEKARIPKEQLDFAVKKAIDNFNTLDRSKKYLLSFSAGKDSVVMLDIALKTDLKFDIVYYYYIKDFGPDQEIIEYFEKKYGVKIEQRESTQIDRMKRNQIYIVGNFEELPERESNKKGLELDEELIFSECGYDYNLIGSRMSDSLTRRMNIKVSGWLQKRKIYPIYHFSEKEIWNYIYTNKIPVNKFYFSDRRSFEKFDYKTLRNLSFGFENEFEKLVKDFPLIPALFWIKERKENNLQEYFVFDEFSKESNKAKYGENLDEYIIFAFDEIEKKRKFCALLGIEEGTYILDFSIFDESEIEGFERNELGKAEKMDFMDEGGGATTAEKKKIEYSNLIDNFLCIRFKNEKMKRKCLMLTGIPENANALDGSCFAPKSE